MLREITTLELARGVWLAIIIVVDICVISRAICDFSDGVEDFIDWIGLLGLLLQFIGFTNYCWF